MPALKRRNRIVDFRLTEEEYASLKNACVDRGAGKISDFARSALLSSVGADNQAVLDQRLSDLESTMRRISDRK